MSFDDERRAIESHMSSGYAATPVWYENAPPPWTGDPPASGYVALFIRTGDATQITLGSTNPTDRFAGAIIVQVFVSEVVGTTAALQIADALSALFVRRQLEADSSGLIRTEVPYIIKIGVRHGWYQVNVVVPYKRDTP